MATFEEAVASFEEELRRYEEDAGAMQGRLDDVTAALSASNDDKVPRRPDTVQRRAPCRSLSHSLSLSLLLTLTLCV